MTAPGLPFQALLPYRDGMIFSVRVVYRKLADFADCQFLARRREFCEGVG